MYKLGHKPHHRQKLYAVLILLFAGLVIAGIWAANNYFQADTTLSDSPGITRHIDVIKPAVKTVNGSVFSLKVPQNWQPTKSLFIPAAQYAWHGTSRDDAPRRIEVYVDNIPGSMAVNRLLPVRANDDGVVVSDDVSDNCTNFTDADKADKRTGKILAKWSGVKFYCDTANSLRNLVGTGTPDSINSVTVKGSATGAHKFFFVYTDNSAQADYTIFTDMLASFKVR